MTVTELPTESFALRASDGAPQPTFRVTVLGGPERGTVFVVDGNVASRVLVGTGATSHLRLTDRTVSRRHAAFSLRDGGLHVEDVGSTNGIVVGSLRVRDAVLTGGEVLVLGGTHLRVERLDQGAVAAVSRDASFGRLVGASVAMRRLYPVLHHVATTDGAVLFEGEPGTGKELAAEVVHERSARKERPFTVLDAARTPAEEADARLFGTAASPGALEASAGGTLVVDEPSELPLASQAKLARFLERRSVVRDDGTALPAVDVRVLAISRADVEREVQAGRLREDLALLLAAARVELPPLRERQGDVTLLATTFFRALRLEDRVLPPLTLRRFEAHSWPGNVRELQAAVVRFATTGEDRADPVRALREEDGVRPTELYERVLGADLPLAQARDIVLEDFERRFVRKVLEKSGGNVTRAAAASGLARRYFQLLRAKRGV